MRDIVRIILAASSMFIGIALLVIFHVHRIFLPLLIGPTAVVLPVHFVLGSPYLIIPGPVVLVLSVLVVPYTYLLLIDVVPQVFPAVLVVRRILLRALHALPLLHVLDLIRVFLRLVPALPLVVLVPVPPVANVPAPAISLSSLNNSPLLSPVLSRRPAPSSSTSRHNTCGDMSGSPCSNHDETLHLHTTVAGASRYSSSAGAPNSIIVRPACNMQYFHIATNWASHVYLSPRTAPSLSTSFR